MFGRAHFTDDARHVFDYFEDGIIEVQVEPKDFAKTRDALKDLGVVDFVTNEITMLPIPDYVKHDVADADKQKLANFVHALDELEDVQNIYTNADFDPLAIPAEEKFPKK